MKLKPIKTQVLVVGAGASGLAAAIASGRNGAQTLLVENSGFLGGISSTLPWLGFHDRDYRQVVKGIGSEVVKKMTELKACSGYVLDPKCGSAVSLDNHLWKCLSMQMVRESGTEIMLHTHVVDTLRLGDRIAGVVVEHKSGRQEIHAKVVIDCSGDGDVAARGGVLWEKGRTKDGLVQAPTLVFRLGGVDRPEFIRGCRNPRNNYREWLQPFPELLKKMLTRLDDMPVIICGGFAPLVREAMEAGELDVPQTRIVGVKLHRPDQFLVVMTRVLGIDPTDVQSLTSTYARVYQQIPPLVDFFKRRVPGFANSYLLEIAPMLGVRESRRIVGDYTLTADDIISGKVFPDAVAMGGYHIDIHRPSGTWVDSMNVPSYTIPLRSLIASGVDGLLMAGKCISATHEAIASTRVIPICMAQGEAVGTAAAIAVSQNVGVRDISCDFLKDVLARQGAECGETLGEPNQQAIEEIGQLPFDEPPTSGEADTISSRSSAWVA